MERCLKVDPARYAGGREAKAGHSSYRAVNSPYDIPSVIRGYFTSDRKKCVIEFKYLTDEKTHRRELGTHVIAVLGDHSQRLYGFDVDVEAVGAQGVQLQCKVREAIRDAFQGLRAGGLSPTVADRYRLAEEVITENSERLFSLAEPAV